MPARWRAASPRVSGVTPSQWDQAGIGGVVFDYDGTIVTTTGRFSPPDGAMVDELVRLHRAGLLIGIATGRGGSAGEDLRKVLPLQTTDFRNLAHGRHAWLHHRADETLVLAFEMVQPSSYLAHKLGLMERRLAAIFRKARDHGNTVLIFDEFDSVGSSRQNAGSASYIISLTNSMLMECDRPATGKILRTFNHGKVGS